MMKLFSKSNAFGLLLSALLLHAYAFSQNLTVRGIMAEPSIAGMRVEGEKLSPDGKSVVFLWNAEGRLPRDLYLSSTERADARVILRVADLPKPQATPTPENKLNYGLNVRDDFVQVRQNQFGNFEWSPDSKKLLFSQAGDLYVLTLGESKPKRFTKTQSPEAGARFLDNQRILFQMSGNLFVLNTVDATLIQLTRESNPQAFLSVSGGTANKSGTLVAYTVSDSSKQRALFVPNYLDEFVQAGSVRRGWSEQKLLVVPTDGSRDTPFEIKLPKAEGVSSFRRMVWAADGTSLIVDRNDKDTKRRQLYYVHNVGDKGEQIVLVTEETDDKWQAPLSTIFEANPKKSGELFFGSERDGYNHLYLAKLTPNRLEPNTAGEVRAEGDRVFSSNVAIMQLTRGNWQVEWAKWKPDGERLLYLSTEGNAAQRDFFDLSVASGQKDGLAFSQAGMRTGPQMNESGEPMLIFSFSMWNQPDDLQAQRACGNCGGINFPLPITASVPAPFMRRSWSPPKFVDIRSRDGKVIKSKIYLPPGHDAKKKYPMAIFVHGAGYLQNIIDGWNNYYREFMFNQILTQKGYVVLDIDYRGSAGYGRDWRTDVYDFLGGKDYDDHIDGIDFMVRNYGVDQKRIGVYGGSYGGFMAGMLVTRAPDRIAAAAALRPVFDWKNYYAANPSYTVQRLGFPDKNPEAYKRSSPISYADKLERPLLILHGMADDNVHVQDSQQMIEKLIRLGKTQYFEAMLYPSENHAFVRPESWADEYERILAFFEKHLK